MSKKIVFNQKKSPILPIVICSCVVLIALIIVISFLVDKSKQNKEISSTRNEKTEENDNDKIGVQYTSPISIPEETEKETVPTETTKPIIAPVETEPESTGVDVSNKQMVTLTPNWAENRATVPWGNNEFVPAELKKACFDTSDETLEFCRIHNVFPLYVYNDIHETNLSSGRDNSTLYYIKLDGIIFPTEDEAYSNMFFTSRWNMTYALSWWHLYVNSDFIPDENGIIHGTIFISEKITEFDPSFNNGQEIYKTNLVSLNEYLLALGMAAPDTSYTGEFANIYSQYSGFEAGYNNYPLSEGFYDLISGYIYQAGENPTSYYNTYNG